METIFLCRMFVDALDVQMYDKHNSSGRCYLSFSKVNYSFIEIGPVIEMMAVI